MSGNKVKLTVRIPKWLRDRYRDMAESEAETMNQAINRVLKDHLKKPDPKMPSLSHNVN